MAIEGKGRWVTIAGQHIYIEEGETPMSAYVKHMAKRKAGKKGSQKETSEETANRLKKEKEIGERFTKERDDFIKSIGGEKEYEKLKEENHKRVAEEAKKRTEERIEMKKRFSSDKYKHLEEPYKDRETKTKGSWKEVAGEHVFVQEGEKPTEAYLKKKLSEKSGQRISEVHLKTPALEEFRNKMERKERGIEDNTKQSQTKTGTTKLPAGVTEEQFKRDARNFTHAIYKEAERKKEKERMIQENIKNRMINKNKPVESSKKETMAVQVGTEEYVPGSHWKNPIIGTKKIDKSKENRFRVSDPKLIQGEKTGEKISRQQIEDYFMNKGLRTADTDLLDNITSYTNAYYNYREELRKRKGK